VHKRIFGILAVMTLTGCPYTQGCEDSTPAAPDPGDAGRDLDGSPEDDAGPDGGDSGPALRLGPAASIDFGPDPVGGPALSTLSCPELAMPATTATVYVDAAATGAEAGTRAAPFHTLERAFASAAPSAIVWIAAGTYAENVVVPDKDLVVFGGFTAGFAGRTDACATILEAADTSRPVLAADATVLSFALEGVTIRKGRRGIAVTGDERVHASFTLARSVVANNGDETVTGGGAYLEGVNARIFRSVFEDNRGSKGAALASNGDVSLVVDQSLFERNLGYSDHGGGLYLSPTTAKVTRNTFRGNATGVGIPPGFGGNWGGAAIVYNNSPTQPARADFSFNVFTDNLAGIGAAVFVDEGATLTMSHDLVYRNRAYLENGFLRGAAIYVDGSGEPGGGSTFLGEYLTVADNLYDEHGVERAPAAAFGGNLYVEGLSKARVVSSIFWNNGDNGFYVEAGNELSVSYAIGTPGCTSSNAEGFVPASATICKIGAGVFLPPAIHFVDEPRNDFHEKSTAGHHSRGLWEIDAVSSPAIDKADPADPVGDEPAPHGNRANLGAFARTTEASKSP